MAAVEEALDGAGASARRRRAVRPRDDRGHERAARGTSGAHGAARHGGVHRPRGARTPGQGRAVPAVRGPPAATGAGRAADSRPRADGRGRRAARAGRGGAAGGARRARCRGGRGLPPVGLPPSASTSERVASLLEEAVPGIHVSTSHETAGVFREYERCATTVVDAALSPLLRGYLERLTERAREAGLPEPEVMLSSGGTASAAIAARHASWTVLSGPAGGAVGAARMAARSGAAADGRGAPRADAPGRRRRRARHGRHVVRRLADRGRCGRGEQRARGRRARAGAADGGRAHGRRRRGVDRVAGLGRRAAGGAAVGGGRPRARVLRARRRGADGDRRQPADRPPRRTTPRWPAASGSTGRRRSGRWPGWPRSSGSASRRPPPASSAWRAPRWPRR